MSTISQTPKINVFRIPENRVLSLLLVAAGLIIMFAIISNAAVENTARSFDQNAYNLYRHGEWLSVPVSHAQAYQIFRRGEVASPVTHAEAYQLYRQGEWVSAGIPVTASDLSAYHLSERARVDALAGLAAYQLSERTLIDPQAGMAIYQESERTSLPVQFNPYQRSEWFGE